MKKKMSTKAGVEQKKVKPTTGVQESGHKKKRATKPTIKSKGC
jgi:hypothetical protein